MDGLGFSGNNTYMLLEHKEAQTIWEASHFSREGAVKQIDDMLQRHLQVTRILEPYGCRGVAYSTNAKEMADLLAERIGLLKASMKGARVPLYAPRL
jgi:hypothetical protein